MAYERDTALAQDSADPDVLARLAGHRSWRVVSEVAKNPNTPQALLEALAEHWSFGVRAKVAEVMPVLGEWEARFLGDAEHAVRRGLAKRSDLSEATLVALLADPSNAVRKQLAWSSGHPDSVWSALVRDPWPDVRIDLARNPRTPAWVLAALAADRDFMVRERVAYSGRLDTATMLAMIEADPSVMLPLSRKKDVAYSDEVLAAFCRSLDKWVRCNVVDRQDCPASVLAILAEDSDTEVRARVAKHPNATTDMLVALALGRSDQVLWQLSQREGGLGFLTENPDPAVRRKALRVIAPSNPLFAPLLRDTDAKVRVAAVEAGASEADLASMAGDPDKGVRVAVAKCSRSEEVLGALVGDGEWVVRRAVAANKACPPTLLTDLSDDPHLSVRKAAADAFLAAFTR